MWQSTAMIRRLVVAALLTALTASCGHKPPSYESNYTTPPSPVIKLSTPAPSTESIMASFVDTFDRPNTQLGLGPDWDMRGVPARGLPLPPATDGFILDDAYTYSGNDVVYATRQFRGAVQRIGTTGRWRALRDGGADTTLGMAITPNENLVTDLLQLTANRKGWQLMLRRQGGFFQVVTSGSYESPLEVNHVYTFELETAANTVTVHVPGADVTKELDTNAVIGDRAFWEERPDKAPADAVFDFDTVWAVEAGQPTSPVTQ
jgi:hypothetical protein